MTIPDDTPEASVEDDIRAAMAEIGAEEAEAPQAGENLEKLDVSDEAQTDAPGRERDEHGRFVSKEKEPAAEPAQDAQPVEAQAEAPLDDPGAQPPHHAPAYVKENWGKLDAPLRDAISAREAEVAKIITRYDGERLFGRDMQEVVKPFEPLIRSLGAEPKQAISYLLNADATLRTGTPQQKSQMLAKIVQDYGIPMPQQGEQQQQAPTNSDPRLETVEQRIMRLEMDRQRDIQAHRETQDREVQAQLEAFGSDPANAHFARDDVRALMGSLIQSGQAANLADAYDKAVHAIPETRALHLDALRVNEERKRNEAAADTARKARQASPSVTGAPGVPVPTVQSGDPNASVEEDVRAALMAVAGRA